MSGYEKGIRFQDQVAGLINLLWGLAGKRRVTSTPRSGAIFGFKGDLRNLPKELSEFVIECKDCKKLELPQWWNQSKEEAEVMGKYPWLVFKLGDEVLSCKRLEDDLKLLKEVGK
jgi:hypothetical protein